MAVLVFQASGISLPPKNHLLFILYDTIVAVICLDYMHEPLVTKEMQN